MEARLPALAQCKRNDEVKQEPDGHAEAGPADDCVARSVRKTLQYGSADTRAHNVRARASQREQERVLKRSADLVDQLDCRQIQTEYNGSGRAKQRGQAKASGRLPAPGPARKSSQSPEAISPQRNPETCSKHAAGRLPSRQDLSAFGEKVTHGCAQTRRGHQLKKSG